jgi:pimeloyl-ACP methyl ester carboxylesterase
MLNVSNEEHIGPSRLWVELARRWTAGGLRCVRFDLTGIGDSPPTSDDPPSPFYERPWYADVREVARQLSPDDPGDVVLVGLCSGAFLAVEAGLALGARGVCVICPPTAIDFLWGFGKLDQDQPRLARHLVGPLKRTALHLRWVSVALLKVLRVLAPRHFRRKSLQSLVRQGTDLLVLASPEDVNPWPDHPGFDRFFGGQFVAPQGYEVTLVPGLDHSMHGAEGRQRVEVLLSDHVASTFA